MKKIIALIVSSIFALSLSSAFGQETLNPWERNLQTTPAKKETAGKKARKNREAKVKKTKSRTGKANKHKGKTVKAGKKKESGKKKFIFW